MPEKPRLGVAGVPTDIAAVELIARNLGVALVYLVDGQGARPPVPENAEVVQISLDDMDKEVPRFQGLDLRGVWLVECRYQRWLNQMAPHFAWPHLNCAVDHPDRPCPIPNARSFSADGLARLVESGSGTIPIPSWVRSSCGNGDSSCMRVEHPSDLSLAIQKLRKRSPEGVLRIQPTVEGDIYRLLAFKTGRTLVPVDLVEEIVTPSVYRVPLGVSMPVARRGALFDETVRQAREVSDVLPTGWGMVQMEFVISAESGDIILTDVQAPAGLDQDLQTVFLLSQGIDLTRCAMECALGHHPSVAPTCETGIAFSWLLTRSGVVVGFEGVEAAPELPGVVAIHINAHEGDILTHVVDMPTRERGGYIVTRGATAAIARERLEVVRNAAWISTSPALS